MLKGNNLAKISSVACLVLAIGIMVLQFLPFWSFTGENCGEQTISINSYMWFPNGDVQNDFEEVIKDEVFPGQGLNDNKVVNKIVLFPAFTFAFCVIAIAVTILKFKNGFLPALAATVAGVVATIGYLLSATLKFGNNWLVHLIVCICILIIAIVLTILNIRTLCAKKDA